MHSRPCSRGSYGRIPPTRHLTPPTNNQLRQLPRQRAGVGGLQPHVPGPVDRQGAHANGGSGASRRCIGGHVGPPTHSLVYERHDPFIINHINPAGLRGGRRGLGLQCVCVVLSKSPPPVRSRFVGRRTTTRSSCCIDRQTTPRTTNVFQQVQDGHQLR